MERNILTTEQVTSLLSNPNVTNCTSKSVTYSKEFKIWAMQQYYEEGLGPNAIFQKAGFNLSVLGRDKAKSCLKRWRKIYKTRGQEGLSTDSRGKQGGRKPRTKESTDIEYLQTKVAYLEAENAFLKKLKTKPTI